MSADADTGPVVTSSGACCALETPVGHRLAVVFGAGKVGRGFIGHLLQRAGWRIHFVDVAEPLIERLCDQGQYRIRLLNDHEQVEVIRPISASTLGDIATLRSILLQSDLLFTSLGADQLAPWARHMAPWLAERVRTGALDLILCENHARPAAAVRDAFDEALGEDDRAALRAGLGVAQAQVLRSCIEPDAALRAADPLGIQVQDHWTLPLDGDALLRADVVAEVAGLDPRPNFDLELTRKLYTYNAINAVVCYLGALVGHEMLSQSANDAGIARLADAAGAEASAALVAAHGFDPADQQRWASGALRKYQDARITDPIERNARDPIRKLGPADRIIGPIRLCLDQGLGCDALCVALAAALRYLHPDDPASQHLQALRADTDDWSALTAVHPDMDPRLEGVVTEGNRQLAEWLAARS